VTDTPARSGIRELLLDRSLIDDFWSAVAYAKPLRTLSNSITSGSPWTPLILAQHHATLQPSILAFCLLGASPYHRCSQTGGGVCQTTDRRKAATEQVNQSLAHKQSCDRAPNSHVFDSQPTDQIELPTWDSP